MACRGDTPVSGRGVVGRGAGSTEPEESAKVAVPPCSDGRGPDLYSVHRPHEASANPA